MLVAVLCAPAVGCAPCPAVRWALLQSSAVGSSALGRVSCAPGAPVAQKVVFLSFFRVPQVGAFLALTHRQAVQAGLVPAWVATASAGSVGEQGAWDGSTRALQGGAGEDEPPGELAAQPSLPAAAGRGRGALRVERGGRLHARGVRLGQQEQLQQLSQQQQQQRAAVRLEVGQLTMSLQGAGVAVQGGAAGLGEANPADAKHAAMAGEWGSAGGGAAGTAQGGTGGYPSAADIKRELQSAL